MAFRVTPDITRETGTGSSLNGSYTYRLKYAYAQFNLDDWMTRGSFARFGMQQTPWVDFIDSVYRYRFQGPTLEDREGILSSSDVGATFRYVFARQLRRSARRHLQRGQLQPRGAERSEGPHGARHVPAAAGCIPRCAGCA